MIWVSLQSESPIKRKNIISGGGGGELAKFEALVKSLSSFQCS